MLKASRQRLRGLAGRGALAAADRVRSSDSPRLREGVRGAALIGLGSPSARVSAVARVLFESSLPNDPPFQEAPLPAVGLVIACHPRDIPVLGLAIAGAYENSRNPIARAVVISPSGMRRDALPDYPGLTIARDADLLDPQLKKRVRQLVPEARQGWVTQQLLKFLAVMESAEDACLVLDTDTVLLRPRTWLDARGRQALAVAHERHGPYLTHVRTVWPRIPESGISYVTHHQLMQKDIVMQMFGSGRSGLIDWIDRGDWSETSAVSEYHSYGAWLISQRPERATLTSWGNVAVPRGSAVLSGGSPQELLSDLGKRFPRKLSVSLHSYLDS